MPQAIVFRRGRDGMTEACELSSMSREGKELSGHERLKCFLPRKENAQSQSDHRICLKKKKKRNQKIQPRQIKIFVSVLNSSCAILKVSVTQWTPAFCFTSSSILPPVKSAPPQKLAKINQMWFFFFFTQTQGRLQARIWKDAPFHTSY